MNIILTTFLAATIGLVMIVPTTSLPLDFIVQKQLSYYDLLFPEHDTPLPTWNIAANRFLTEKLGCCTDSVEDIPALFSMEHRTPLINYLFELRGYMKQEIGLATKNGNQTNLARFVPELIKRTYRLEYNMIVLYPYLRDQIMNGQTGTNGVQNEFEYSLVMFNTLLDLLNQIREREAINVPVEGLPTLSDLHKRFFTKELIEKMAKDRQGLLTGWERMNPLERCFDMQQRGLDCTADVNGVYTSTTTTTQAPTTRKIHYNYFHKYQRKPRGRKPRRD